ncbi:rifin [Plasmodium falciparum NF54]|uniref:Rifin n=2 Tax=Plasmodium falciparum TaxID=5833 RepID=Q8I3E3_PLAF7|nr:rifin [Plasmodium falciparum 3D7]KAF4330812.1 rifin [Plasmodium falciparum NF54]PKC45187.1 rifin [Plasmodium falciparum NF54]CAD51689.1 rifin [Plasmodium falciparum 3D7]|eukprot:XP_001351879.1 rifin [Plasmodium falciparum 3D7]
MKLNYTKILLFFFPLNILLTSYHVHSKNKPHTTPHHTPTTTSRVLSECDTQSSIHDNDEEINSVKEVFDRQTSQRFEEYQERMKEKRQKRKEQRDKNIQKIIQKDRMEKNIAEKIEKGCLMCGCGLGGVAGSIGLFGGVAINIWKPAALKAAIKTAIANSADKIAEAANSAGIQAGKEFVIAGLKRMGISTLGGKDLGTYFATTSYKNITNIAQAVYEQHFEKCADYPLWSVRVPSSAAKHDFLFCQSVSNQIPSVSQPKQYISRIDVVQKTVQNIVTKAEGVAADASAVKSAELTAEITKEQTTAINTIFMSKQTAIIASVVAILIIVLIMVIIYLILRYRRKKKMKKKAQYTKLLNE